jgi:SAM-dependent methyltransferase
MGAQSEVDETGQQAAPADLPTPLIAPDPASMAWPDEELIYRVTGYTDRTTFYISGHQSVQDLEAVLGVVGRSLATFPTILDFGSGCGRILLWLEHLADTSSLHGSDIDARAIAWTRENIPWAESKVNQPLPPLDYPDATFDLVFSHSVFTHIDEHYQNEWLTELRRVVKPGGYAILSVHGETAFSRFEEAVAARGGDPSVIRRELSTRGISFIKDDAFTGGPFPDFYHSTFHAPWYVFEHWARWFTVAAFLPKRSMAYQDFVLLQRPEDDGPEADGAAADGAAGDTAPAAGTAPAKAKVVPIERGASGAPAGRAGTGVVPTGSSPAADTPESALFRAGRLLHDGIDLDAGQPHGQLGRVARRLAEKLLGTHRGQRTVNVHQREVDRALFTALWELDSTVSAATRSGGVPLTELNGRLWDAIRLQGERINRLENDLWQAVTSRDRTSRDRTSRDLTSARDGTRDGATDQGRSEPPTLEHPSD